MSRNGLHSASSSVGSIVQCIMSLSFGIEKPDEHCQCLDKSYSKDCQCKSSFIVTNRCFVSNLCKQISCENMHEAKFDMTAVIEGACEPRNMGYMERLGLWGTNSPFATFGDFLEVVGSRGVGALEMIAMDMKAQGMYVCRTLSFAGTSSIFSLFCFSLW